MTKAWTVLERVSTIAVIVAASVFVWRLTVVSGGRSVKAGPKITAPVSIRGSATIGNAEAPVALVVYSDFECTFCGKFARETWPELQRAYVDTGKVLGVFRNLPLSNHPAAFPAAEAGECAGRQGKFWQMHEWLFAEAKNIAPGAFEKRAAELGLDQTAWQKCMRGEARERIHGDVDGAAEMGISSTPTILVGRLQPDRRVRISQVIRGARPLTEFRDVIDRLLEPGPEAERAR